MTITNRGKDKHGLTKWRIEVYRGTDPMTGKPRRISETFHGTKTEAKKHERDLITQLENGLDVKGGEQLFSEYVESYLEARASDTELSRRTKESEEYHAKRLVSVFGGYRLCDIDTQVIDAGLSRIKNTGNKRGKILSGTTMTAHYKLMSRLMERAVNYDLLRKNPCKLAKHYKKDTKETPHLTPKQAQSLRAQLLKDYETELAKLAQKEQRQAARNKTATRSSIRGLSTLSGLLSLFVILHTGIRHGEALGVQWGDIDLENATLNISRSMDRDGTLKSPKSEAGNRTLHLDHETVRVLKNWKSVQAAELASLGVLHTVGERREIPVFCSDTGGKYGYNNLNRFWNNYRARKKLPENVTIHGLRHTFLTLANFTGADPKTLQTLAGHADIGLTLSTYVHPVEERRKEASANVAALLAQKPRGAEITELPIAN